MAKQDLPEYKRNTQIEPQAQPQGFESAMRGANEGINLVGKLGLQTAQNSANELARISGLEAGKTPGRVLLPPITPSDQEFVNAYKSQEYNTVLSNTSQYIKNLYTRAVRDPSKHSALDFMAQAQQGIADATGNVTEENRIKLKDDLQGIYLQAQNELDDRVYGHNQKTQRDAFVNDLSVFLRLVNDVGMKSPEEAQKLTNDYLEKLDGYKGILSEGEITNFKRAIIDNLGTTIKIGEAQTLIRAGKMEAKLKELAKMPATTDNLDTASIYKNAYNNYQNMVRAQEDLVTTQYTQKRVEGRLSEADMQYLKTELSPLAYAQFELDTAKWMLANKEKQDIYDYYEANKGNALALADLSPSQLDDVFAENLKRLSQSTGQPPDLEMMANLAKEIDVPIPAFNKKLNAAINSGNGAVAAMGAQVYGQMTLSPRGARAVAGVTNESGQRADSLNRLLGGGVPLEDAMAAINKQYDNVSATQIKEREETLPKLISSDHDLKNLKMQKNYLATNLGLNSAWGDNIALPDGVTLEFMEVLKNNYVKSGNLEDAKTNALKQIAQTYQKTSINGKDQLMRNAPSKYMSDEQAKAQLHKQVTELFSNTNADFDSNDTSPSLFKYRLKSNEIDDVLSDIGIYKTLRVERIDSMGNITNGTIQIESDKYSEFMPVGIQGSYGIYFQPDNSFELSPIYDSNRGYSNARYVINAEDTIKRLKGEKEMADIRNLERQKGLEEIREMQRKVRDLRIAEGENVYGF